MKFVNLETVTFETVSQYAQSFGKAELLEQTRSLVSKERDLTARTLILFQEIEKRMIHLEMGYSSLFDMLVQHFGLSEGSASRRIASIRLMAELPEIDKKIKEGSLSLSNAAAAQRFFKAEEKNQKPLDLEMKKEVLASLAGKSTREAEKELIQRSSVPLELQTPDQIKPKGEEHVEIRFLAPQSLAGLLEEVRGLLAHRLPMCSMAELIQLLAEMGIEKIRKERFGVGCKPRSSMKPMPKTSAPTLKANQSINHIRTVVGISLCRFAEPFSCGRRVSANMWISPLGKDVIRLRFWSWIIQRLLPKVASIQLSLSSSCVDLTIA